jgi:prepilin-type N-terminal cleavage/methylation domain-containing protein
MATDRQRGFTLVEVMVVMSIVAVSLAGLYALSGLLRSGSRADAAAAHAAAVSSAVAQVYGGAPYTGLTARDVRRLLPATMWRVDGGGTPILVDPWGRDVSFFAVNATSWRLLYPLVPSGDCQAFVVQVASLFDRVLVNNGDVLDGIAGPLNHETARIRCAMAARVPILLQNQTG